MALSAALGFVCGAHGQIAFPCTPDTAAGLDVEWRWFFRQAGPDTFAPKADTGAFTFAINQDIHYPDNLTILDGKVSVPTTPARLESWQGPFFSSTSQDAAALLAAFPAGDYQISVRGVRALLPNDPWNDFFPPNSTIGEFSQTFNIPQEIEPSIPKLLNFAEAQEISTNSPFVLRFAPFPGSSSNRVMSVSLSEGDGAFPLLFFPDFRDCANLKLPLVTDSLTIPAGLLKRGKTYRLKITHTYAFGDLFPKIGPLELDVQLFKATELEIKTSNQQGPSERLSIEAKGNEHQIRITATNSHSELLYLVQSPNVELLATAPVLGFWMPDSLFQEVLSIDTRRSERSFYGLIPATLADVTNASLSTLPTTTVFPLDPDLSLELSTSPGDFLPGASALMVIRLVDETGEIVEQDGLVRLSLETESGLPAPSAYELVPNTLRLQRGEAQELVRFDGLAGLSNLTVVATLTLSANSAHTLRLQTDARQMSVPLVLKAEKPPFTFDPVSEPWLHPLGDTGGPKPVLRTFGQYPTLYKGSKSKARIASASTLRFQVPADSAVISAKAGVVKARSFRATGKIMDLLVDHGHGFIFRYCGLKANRDIRPNKTTFAAGKVMGYTAASDVFEMRLAYDFPDVSPEGRARVKREFINPLRTEFQGNPLRFLPPLIGANAVPPKLLGVDTSGDGVLTFQAVGAAGPLPPGRIFLDESAPSPLQMFDLVSAIGSDMELFFPQSKGSSIRYLNLARRDLWKPENWFTFQAPLAATYSTSAPHSIALIVSDPTGMNSQSWGLKMGPEIVRIYSDDGRPGSDGRGGRYTRYSVTFDYRHWIMANDPKLPVKLDRDTVSVEVSFVGDGSLGWAIRDVKSPQIKPQDYNLAQASAFEITKNLNVAVTDSVAIKVRLQSKRFPNLVSEKEVFIPSAGTLPQSAPRNPATAFAVKSDGGYRHSALIRADKSLWVWGANSKGQLGLGDTLNRPAAELLPGGRAWRSVSCGDQFSIALTEDGSLFGWGANYSIGANFDGVSLSPTPIGNAGEWAGVAAGQAHVLAIKRDGTLWSWGINSERQLGNREVGFNDFPAQQIGASAGWWQVAANYRHSLALQTNGTLWGWGGNGNGQLGRREPADNVESPVQLDPATDWVQLASESFRSWALKSDGTLWFSTRDGFQRFGSDADWLSVACGSAHVLARKRDGSLWAWGENEDGQVNGFPGGSIEVPARIEGAWSHAAAGDYHSVGLQPSGRMFAWGANQQGARGSGEVSSRKDPEPIVTGRTWETLDVGSSFSVAIAADDTLWAWGMNNLGQLGNGSEVPSSEPTLVSGDAKWRKVAAGASHAVAIRSDGTLWGWGNNQSKQLGAAAANPQTVPVQIGAANDWIAVSCEYNETYALQENGSLWSWGGKGGSDGSMVATGVASISSGAFHSVFVDSEGFLWALGSNFSGQLGDGSRDFRRQPVKCLAGPGWAEAGGGGWSYSVALAQDGSVAGWGDPDYGYTLPTLRGNDDGIVFAPETMAVGNQWESITGGSFHCYGIMANNTLWAWGANPDGHLGLGDSRSRNSPAQVGVDSDWVLVRTTRTESNTKGVAYHTLGLKRDGSLWGWGEAGRGQLGNGYPFGNIQVIEAR